MHSIVASSHLAAVLDAVHYACTVLTQRHVSIARYFSFCVEFPNTRFFHVITLCNMEKDYEIKIIKSTYKINGASNTCYNVLESRLPTIKYSDTLQSKITLK